MATYPQLIPLPAGGSTAPTIDQAPSYSDLFNQYFADDVTPDAGMDDDIAALTAVNDGFAADLPNLDTDAAGLPDDGGAFDPSGSNAISSAFPAVQAQAQAICQQFAQLLTATGVPPTGQCDGGAGTGSPTSPTGPSGPTAPGSPASPYQANPNPPPDGAPQCADLPYTPDLVLAPSGLVEGGVPVVVVIKAGQVRAGTAGFYGSGTVTTGPTDMVFVTPGAQIGGSPGFFSSLVVTIYPARAGTFNAGMYITLNSAGDDFGYVCVSFTVGPAPAGGAIPGATPQTADALLATVSGQRTAPAVLDLGTFQLGAPPVANYSYNTQWGVATSGVYGDGELVGGPADMLVTLGSLPDPASPGAWIVLEEIVLPIRAGAWAWLVRYYEDAAKKIPFYIAFTATVTAPPASTTPPAGGGTPPNVPGEPGPGFGLGGTLHAPTGQPIVAGTFNAG